MRRVRALLLVLACCLDARASLAQVRPRAPMAPAARALFAEAMRFGDAEWSQPLLAQEPGTASTLAFRSPKFSVRAGAYYAVGLLSRDHRGDRARAAAILQLVLNQQYARDGSAWSGTFRHTPDEPQPPANAVAYREYDPNWREFVGCTLALILLEYPDRVPPPLRARLQHGIEEAVAGEAGSSRLQPLYTNIALMYGFLLDFTARTPFERERATRWADAVYATWAAHHEFPEFNSPTYYGVDLYALALWRKHGSNPELRGLGREMEAGLWRDLAAFYHARLRNVSGPFDRTYSMDMEHYVSQVGVWLATRLKRADAPLPPIVAGTTLASEGLYALPFSVLGTAIPKDALASFRAFGRERLVTRPLSAERVVTAWMGADAMWGGESASGTKNGDANAGQFAGATVQWRTPTCRIGWIRLIAAPAVDSRADATGLTIDSPGDIVLQVYAPESAASLLAGRWDLPGLGVDVAPGSRTFSLQHGAADRSVVEAHYSGSGALTLHFIAGASGFRACSTSTGARNAADR